MRDCSNCLREHRASYNEIRLLESRLDTERMLVEVMGLVIAVLMLIIVIMWVKMY